MGVVDTFELGERVPIFCLSNKLCPESNVLIKKNIYEDVYNIQRSVKQSHEQINYRTGNDNASLIVLIMKNENI